MNSVCALPAANRWPVYILLPTALFFWAAMVLAEDLADLDRSSRYDNSLRNQVNQDTEWRLPIDDAYRFGNRIGTTASSRKTGSDRQVVVEGYDTEFIEDFTNETFERPSDEAAGFTFKFRF